MKPTLADFKALVPFSGSIEAFQVDPHVETTRVLDLLPLVPAEAMESINQAGGFVVLEWPVSLSGVTVGTYAGHRERVYRAAVNNPTSDIPADGKSTAQWEYDPLRTLWFYYLRPYWVWQAFARLNRFHGKNFTKSGVTVPADPEGTYVQASSASRAELQAEVNNTASAYYNRLSVFLHRDYPRAEDTCRPHHRRRRGLRSV